MEPFEEKLREDCCGCDPDPYRMYWKLFSLSRLLRDESEFLNEESCELAMKETLFWWSLPLTDEEALEWLFLF